MGLGTPDVLPGHQQSDASKNEVNNSKIVPCQNSFYSKINQSQTCTYHPKLKKPIDGMAGFGAFGKNSPGARANQVNRKNPYHKQKGIRVNQCHKLGSNSREQHTSNEELSQGTVTSVAFFQHKNQQATNQTYRAPYNVEKKEEIEEKFTHWQKIKIQFI